MSVVQQHCLCVGCGGEAQVEGYVSAKSGPLLSTGQQQQASQTSDKKKKCSTHCNMKQYIIAFGHIIDL